MMAPAMMAPMMVPIMSALLLAAGGDRVARRKSGRYQLLRTTQRLTLRVARVGN